MFKKKKINKVKISNNIINIIWLLVLVLVFTLGLFTINFAKEIDFFDIKESIGNNNNVPKIIKSNSVKEINKKNKINILLLGRWWIRNDAPNLTDSIILASINKETKIISMFSIPRDLYIKNYKWNKSKINKVYASFKAKTWSTQFWVNALKYNIELLTWETIDHYVNIDFKWFVKFIDSIWGVKITLDKNFVDTKFPDENWGYRTFVIRKWTWNLSWEVALNYARSRHSTSDFDRSLRQQQIIKSVKNKLFEWWFFSKIWKAKKFYDIFIKYVDSNIKLKDALKIFTEIKDNDYTILSSNLNDSCFEWDPLCIKWWFLYVPERGIYGWASVLLVNGTSINNLDDYNSIKKYLSLVFDRTIIYKENLNITVLNSTKSSLLAWDLWFALRKYGLNVPFNRYSISTLREKSFEKSTVNYKKSFENSETIKFLKENMWSFEFKWVDDLEHSLDKNSVVEIIIWDNYNEIILEIKKDLN
jgi:LCP family protein required for cell wall assembly